MTGSMIDNVDQRTQLAGHNRLELLLFELDDGQVFGINVFKVREALPCPPLTQLPHAHACICGIARIREQVISIFDLSACLGSPANQDQENSFVVITEYNRSTQGFLVNNINRIVNISWADIQPPPSGLGDNNFLTAITEIDNTLIKIIDVEKVLADIIGTDSQVSESLAAKFINQNQQAQSHILVVDDSSVARKQIQKTLEQIGIDCTTVQDGQQALSQLKTWQQAGHDMTKWPALIISDIEMPTMDGYSLTAAIRRDPELQHLKVLLHSSMSGEFNGALVKKVGANGFIAKFEPNELAGAVQDLLDRQ